MTDDIQDTLDERGKTHGTYVQQAATADDIRDVLVDTPNWHTLRAYQRDALLMIAVKISRILNGDANALDHWVDGAGYFTLAANEIRKGWP